MNPAQAPTAAPGTPPRDSLSQWRKRMTVTGGSMAFVGVILMAVFGVVLGTRGTGDWQAPAYAASVGVFLVVIGAYLARRGVAGPFPTGFRERRPRGPGGQP